MVDACQLQQIRAMTRDELLVGGYHRLAGLQCTPDKFFGRRQRSYQFDDDVGGVENCVEVFSPDYFLRNPFLLLAGDVAIVDVGQAERGIAALKKNPGYGASDGAEAEDRDTTQGAAILRRERRILRPGWRSLAQLAVWKPDSFLSQRPLSTAQSKTRRSDEAACRAQSASKLVR